MTSLSKQRSLFSYTNLVHAIAGGCGSAVAMSTLYPLDTVRTRLQLDDTCDRNTFSVMKKIYEEEGLSGLYRGLLPVAESLYCSNFVYFYSFHSLKRIFNHDGAPVKNLLLGMIAGCVNVLTTTPLWVVNTRIKMQNKNSKVASSGSPIRRNYNGLLDGLVQICEQEGAGALWSGTLSSLLLVMNPAIQFMAYEWMKGHLQETPWKNNAVLVFLAGASAKAIATIITYPVQLIQTKQRHGHNYANLPSNAGVVAMIQYILKLYGVKGVFQGLEAKLLQTVLTAALMFVYYEKITNFVMTLLLAKRMSKDV